MNKQLNVIARVIVITIVFLSLFAVSAPEVSAASKKPAAPKLYTLYYY